LKSIDELIVVTELTFVGEVLNPDVKKESCIIQLVYINADSNKGPVRSLINIFPLIKVVSSKIAVSAFLLEY